MGTMTLAGLGIAAGLHGALYGAYKDSPHESFLPRRFTREVALALAGAMSLPFVFPMVQQQSAFTIYLALFALTRIVTEFWKLFVRVEPQGDFRIPTQMHCVVGVVHNPFVRLLLGIGFLVSIYGCYCAFRLIPLWIPSPLHGLLVGLGIGTAEAIAGGYKDGTIEGFSWFKFFKSPSFGIIGGVIASGHTADPAFLLLATIGSMRMFLELLFKMLVRDYAPGKFKSITGPFAAWYSQRRHFIVPYAMTWLLYLVLCSHPNW
jgi:hypothetical protein